MIALGKRKDATLQLLNVNLEPSRHLNALVGDEGALDNQHLLGLGGHRDQVAGTHAEGRDVHAATVHVNVAVAHLLTSLGTGLGEAQTVHNVVQASLQNTE